MARKDSVVKPNPPRLLPAAQFFGVVAALGLLALLFLASQFTRGSQQSQDATLADCLQYLRAQIYVYSLEHGNVPPGFPGNDLTLAPDARTFTEQMTQYTDAQGRPGAVRTASRKLGPYLMDLPANPVTLRRGVLLVWGDAAPSPDDAVPVGWVFNPRTGQIVANLRGADSHGVSYASY